MKVGENHWRILTAAGDVLSEIQSSQWKRGRDLLSHFDQQFVEVLKSMRPFYIDTVHLAVFVMARLPWSSTDKIGGFCTTTLILSTSNSVRLPIVLTLCSPIGPVELAPAAAGVD
jgi:hypothetical protein